MIDALARWHAFIDSGDKSQLDAMLADDVVFESPVVHTPQRGKAITMKYLGAAGEVLGGGSFAYVGEWRAERSAILEFENEIEGVKINGIDMIWWDEAGLITRFKVMVRPLKAINLLHRMMGEQLQR